MYKSILKYTLLLIASFPLLNAQTINGISGQNIQNPMLTVATLPSVSTSNGKTFWISDSSDGTCNTGGGSQPVACKSNGTTWSALTTSGGGALSCFKPQTVNYNESTLAGTSALTASVSLANIALPAEFKVTSVSIQPVTAFVAAGMTALSISLGANGNNTAYSIPCQTGSTCDPTLTASNTNMLDDGGSFSITKAAHTPYLYFSSTGANLNTLTAGSINVYVCGIPLPSTTQVVP